MTLRRLEWSLLLLTGAVFFAGLNGMAQAPATGAIEFFASAKPTAARVEPVRQMSFYLLRKSLADIRKEAEQAEPLADLDKFVDGLGVDVSPELKNWMKKNHTTQLSGGDFLKLLKADDVVAVPEFLDAYTTQNGASLGGGVPIPNYREKDREKNPDKYERLREQYKAQLRRYITENPDTVQGIDVELREKNPGPRWLQLEAQKQQHVDHRTMELAQTVYFAGESDSDLNGRGAFTGLAPGRYWITTLDAPALAGDAHLSWDFTISVRAGETASVELSNQNALESASRTP
jgi:hypothetical protein